MSDLISVIMSVYNECEEELQLAIESILSQTYPNIQFIIVNDNPSNEYLNSLLENFSLKDSRIRIITNVSNMGLAKSLNVALQYAEGEYIARMDADDISTNDRLEKQLAYLKHHPDCGVISANRIDIDENTTEIGTGTDFIISDEHIAEILPYGSIIIHPTVMVRKSVYDELGGYRAFTAGQDYDLWLRVVSAGYKIHILPDKLLYYRIRQNSISKSNYAKQYYNAKYALKCYRQRLKNHGIDSFSEENLYRYLDLCGMNNSQYVNKVNQLHNKISSLKKRKKNVFRVIMKILLLPKMIPIILRDLKFKRLMARYNREFD